MKRLFVFFVSLIYRVFAAVGRRVGRLFGHMPPGRCVVMYYHSIAADEVDQFARQMDELLRHARPVSCDATQQLEPGALHVAITFDDGFRSVAAHALPVLQERHIPVTIFVPSAQLGRRPEWEMESDCTDGSECVMELAELRALPRDWVTIGSHTRTHAHLAELAEDEIRAELAGSRRELETQLGRRVDLLAFPYGNYDQRVLAVARSEGYQRCFAVSPGVSRFAATEFVIPRVAVSPQDSLFEFRLKLSGAYSWLRWASRLKRRLFGNPRRRHRAA